MSVVKEEFLSIKFSRLIRDEDLFPNTTVMIDNDIINDIKVYARDVALNVLNPVDPGDITVTSTVST